MNLIERKLLVAASALLAGLLATSAKAHVISIGYVNNGPGSITFYYGSYHSFSESPATEGSLKLEGINGNPFGPTTVGFSLQVAPKPAGLIDGVNHFYTDQIDDGVLTSNVALAPSAPQTWQGVTFNGLAPGDYRFTYIPIANPTVKWDPWNNEVRTNTVTLTGADLGVPEPTSLAILGTSMVGLGFGVWRRRRRVED